jgi:hypothetical protein
MKNKILIGIIALVSLLLIASVVLSKLGLIDGGEASAKEKDVEIINSVEDLEDGHLYIWKNCEGKKITAEDNEFILCPKGNTNLKYKDKGTSEANYTVWIDTRDDKLIPTVTRADKIVYVSKKRSTRYIQLSSFIRKWIFYWFDIIKAGCSRPLLFDLYAD